MRPGGITVIIGFLMLLQSGLLGQGSPARLRCAEVLNNGDVMLHWRSEIVGTGAYAYVLFHSTVRSGPYSRLDSIIDMTTDSYQHANAGAFLNPQYYYMLIYRLSGISAPSDTLSSILLTSSTLDFEIIDLSWNPLLDPLAPYMHPWYLLYREYPPGNWRLVDSTQAVSISHHFWDCNEAADTVRFRIGVRVDEFNFHCESFSNITGYVLRNQSNRYPPVIDSVSIDADGRAIIGWQPGTEPDILGYTIFSVTASNDSIDFVEGRFNTFYTHQPSNACNGPLHYIILSVDSCGNKSPFPFDPVTLLDRPHSTIYLADIQYDPCQMTNTLSWNEYQNFEPPLGYSRVFVSQDNGPFQELANIPAGQSTYVHTGLLPNTYYAYYVRAYSQDNLKTSTSCPRQVRTYNSPSPAFMYTLYATVEDNQQVSIRFYTDTAAHVKAYRILRGTEPGGPYDFVGSVVNQEEVLVSYIDETASVNTTSYYYLVEVIDSCGQSLIITNISRTIFLEIEALETMQNILSWNAYESWSGNVEGYNIYRRLDDNPVLELLQTVGPSVLFYTDDVSSLSFGTCRITYLVEAYEGEGNAYGFRESSFSNEALAEQESKILMPNAIMPRGINNVLKPVSLFVGGQGYEFLVYNRWGQLIFQTSDPDEGWNGTYNGQYVDAGVYVWLIRYRNSLNQVKFQKGNVAVIY
ncbi:MAG: gliding motility-associated C-terminal domain-containing protein [Bacteroidales bacterium]|nr:gliding motility-associated C-terminal domain-containing protein [Bacteroidales bacterium]